MKFSYKYKIVSYTKLEKYYDSKYARNLFSWENCLDNLHRTLHTACHSAGTLRRTLHDTQKGRTLMVNIFRRRV